jgi:ABC-2 type transport system permease protein
VDAVNLTVHSGELFGLLGPNGAGKTTLIKMLCTLVLPTSGTAHIFGYDLRHEGAVKAAVGLVTTDERSFYWRLTGPQNLEFFAALHHIPPAERAERVQTALEQVNLPAVVGRDFERMPVAQYSTGMRQRLSIARALLHQPRLLFLDEPTKGLDPAAVQGLHRLIREQLTARQGITVFLTTHWLDEAEKLCDRIAILHQGRIRACGSLAELRALLGQGERYTLRVRGLTPALRARLGVSPDGDVLAIPKDETLLNRTIDRIRAEGGVIREIRLHQPPLETIFARLTEEGGPPSAEGSPPAVASTSAAAVPRAAPFTPAALLRLAWAFLQRDLRSELSYRFAFALQLAGILFNVAVFYFLAQLLGEAAVPYLQPYGGDYFAFVLIGIAFVRYFGVGLSSFASSLRHAQTTGTLEAMLATPTNLSLIILSSAQWSYLITTLQVLVYLLVGVLFLGVDLGRGNYPAALLILLLTVFTFSSLGILAASFIMVLKRGDPITWVFSAVSALLGGVYYPIAVLPAWLRPLSNLLPITYALRGLRMALLQGASFRQLLPDVLALLAFSVVLLPLSLYAFRYAVRRARLEGSLTHY